MAPRPPPKLAVTLPSPHHSTLPWHPAMAPRPLPQSWLSPSPTIAHYNGTVRWHPAMAPRPLPQSWSSPSPSNHGTLQWHPAMAPRPLPPCNGTLVPRPVCQNGSSPSPLLEVRTPIAIAIWGIMYLITCTVVINHYVSNFLFRLVNSVQKLLTTYKVTHKINPKTQLPTQAKGYKKRCYSTAKTLPTVCSQLYL